MTDTAPHWADVVSLPALLGAGRRPYGKAIRAALATAGFDDMPDRGSFVVGGMARNGVSMATLPAVMGVSKQAVSQLVDTLVLRGYLDRQPDPDDRRRTTVLLTERGQDAAAEIRRAVESVDAALVERVGADALLAARRVVGVLAEIGRT